MNSPVQEVQEVHQFRLSRVDHSLEEKVRFGVLSGLPGLTHAPRPRLRLFVARLLSRLGGVR